MGGRSDHHRRSGRGADPALAGTATGQQADCVRRLDPTLDPLSKPTWPPNYDDLQCAGVMQPALGGAATHSTPPTLYVNGKQVPVPPTSACRRPAA
jgi:hypothetical protein